MKRFALAVLIAVSINGTKSLADLVVAAEPNVSITSSTTLPVDGFFDVFFQIEPPLTVLPDLAGYQVAIDVSPASSGVVFGVPINPAAPHPPIFPGTPPVNLGSTADRIQATAFVDVGSEAPIVDGAGIIRVPFQVAPGTLGMFDVTIDVGNTILADANALEIPFTARSGKINVAIPEPSSWLFGAIAFISLGTARTGVRILRSCRHRVRSR